MLITSLENHSTTVLFSEDSSEGEREALDETIWSNREWAMHFGGVHENTVLFYFAKSPFFDPTSNNASVETQAMFNPSMMYLLSDRETFEGHLRTLQGLEYMVHLSPRDFGAERPIGEGMWVIRKQNRRKRPALGDQVSVLATYFVIGENIYMSPSVYNIIGSRLLSATSTLSKLFDNASSLSEFTPGLGHRYISPNLKPKEASVTAQSPHPSKENTPMPGQASQNQGQSQSELLTKASGGSNTQAPTKAADLSTLHDAFVQFNSYGYEYMNENPLLGEPGSFVLSASKQSLRAQQEAATKKAKQQQQQQQQTPKKSGPQSSANGTAASPTSPGAAPSLPKVKTEGITGDKEGKSPRSASGPKLKRRKSKAPNTPGATSPATPQG